ncbi:MAG: MBG domain-containing protein [Limosilactobacillus sp.]
MGKNNKQKNMTPERRNYRLYKAKKQWITACATFMLTFGATAVVNASVQADTTDNHPSTSVVATNDSSSSITNNSVALGSADNTTAASGATKNAATATTTSNAEASAVSSSDNGRTASSSNSANAGSSAPVAAQSSSASQSTAASSTSTSNNGVASVVNSGSKYLELAAQKTTDANNIKPIGFTADDGATVSAGYQLTNADAARFIKNSAELEKAGATIAWETTPAVGTKDDGYSNIDANVVVTYKDGTKTIVPVSFLCDPQATFVQNDKSFYYVNHVGDTVTSLDTPDANGTVVFDPNGEQTSLLDFSATTAGMNDAQAIKVSLMKPLDTSTRGIHWTDVYVDPSQVSTGQAFGNILGGYTIKIPYIVEGLNLKKGIPIDSDGNPVINAQLASNGGHTTLGFDPNSDNASTFGQYFYQDFDLAYALGVRTEISDYTAPTDLVNTKTNSFTMSLDGLDNQTEQTVKVNYVDNLPKIDNIYFYNQNKDATAYPFSYEQNNQFMANHFNGTDSSVNELGKVTVNGQTYTSTIVEHDPSMTNWYEGTGETGDYRNVTLNVIFGGQNSSGQPDIFSNNSFNGGGTKAFVDGVKKDFTQLWGDNANPVDLTISTPTTYTDIQTNAYALYASQSTESSTIDITNGNSGVALNNELGNIVKNPSDSSKTQNSNQLPDGNTTWPAGTQFEFVNKNNQQVTKLVAGKTYTGDVVVTLPTGTQTTVNDVAFNTKANPLVQDKSVYKGTTLTAKDLVTNSAVFPDDTTFQFANNSEPNWNQAGTYNAQITATYPTANGGWITTDPVTAKVTVSDRMQFTLTYWDDTDNKQLQKFDMNETQQGYDLNMKFTFDAGKYQSVGVTGVPAGVKFTASFGKPFTDPDASVTTPNYYWDNAADKLFGANITIHLKHKLQSVTDPSQTQLMRTATINYVNVSTGNSVADPATIDVYYTRTITKDLATGQTNYTDWTLDTSRGNKGYQTTANIAIADDGTVTLTPPNVAGYAPSNGNSIVLGKDGALPTTTTVNYAAQAQQFTIHYVDDDEDGKSVSDQVVNGVTDQTLDNNSFVQIPANYQLANGQTAPTSYTFKAFNNEDITIHLAHKIQETTEYQTRTATVKYVNAKTGQSMGNLAPDAQLEIYYQRAVTKDMVTGKALKTGVWQWDKDKNDDGFTNGYHVISGTWTTPTSWNPVSVDVPTVDGYKAFTTGDWEKNSNGKLSTVPANEFTFPAWNGSEGNTTDPTKNAIAYTDDAPVYEGTATHTVYFAPAKQETRTITEHYKKYENGQLVDADIVENADGTKQSYAQAQVHITQAAAQFATNGSTDPSKWTITYGPWGWNQTVGDPNYRGLTIISGGSTIDGKKEGQGLWYPDVTWNAQAGAMKWTGCWRINTPDIAGYTKVNLKGDISRTSDIWGNATNGPEKEYTTSTGDWLFRSDLTTIYVPNSDLTKTVTRTVNIQDPTTGTTRQIPQTVTFNRTARLNDNDDGVTFGALIDNNFYNFKAGDNLWNHAAGQENASGTWNAITGDTIVKPGYTAFINGKAVTEVPAVTVTPNMTDTTVNVTYVKNAAIITISGQDQSKTYNGQPAEITDAIANAISHQISGDSQLALPDGSKVTLTKNDFSFAGTEGNILSGNPSAVGTYHIVLNSNGLQKIKNLDKNFTWSYDPATSFVVYKINPAQAGSITFSATANKTYDGSNVLNGTSFSTKPSIVIEGTDGKALEGVQGYNFQTGDFEFVDSKGNVIQATVGANGQVTGPTNVGTYTIRLTQAGLNNIENANPNINFSRVQLANTGSGTLTINAYAPTLNLSGKGSKTYDGQTVSSAELIKSDKDNTITIKFTVPKQGGGTTTVTYTFNPEMDYTGDYDWYSNGNQIAAPKDAGTYTIKLKADQVKNIFNDLLSKDANYSYLKGNIDTDSLQVSGEATYTIKKKPLKVYLTGGSGMTYTGGGATMPLTDLIKSLTAEGLVGKETLGTFTFDDADFQWYVKNADGTYSVFNGTDIQGHSVQTPINVGTYYIGILPETSTNSGIDTLKRDNTNYDVTIDYSKYYQFDITPAQGAISFSGNQTDTYNGTSHTISGYTVSISGAGLQQGGQNVALNPGDLEFNVKGQWTTEVPANVGNYQVRLSQAALDNLTKNYPNLTWTDSEITSTAKDYVVNPTQVTISFQGGPSHSTYNGSALNVEYTKDFLKGHFGMNGIVAGQTLNYPTINNGFFEWVDANGKVMTSVPTNAGTYTLKVKDLNKLNGLNPNYQIAFAKDDKGNDQNGWTWIIDKAPATITFTSGSQTTPWTGQATVLDPANFAVTITTNNGQTLTSDALTVDDFQFYNQAGEAIATPTEVGNYTIKLNAAGLAKIEKDTANYAWTNNASGNYEITKAAATITLDGSNSMTYNGQAASFPVNADGSLSGYTVTLSNGQTYTLKPGDLRFSTMVTGADGKSYLEVTNAPVNAGTYNVTLSDNGLANINKVDGDHYQYTLGSSTATFTIKKADAKIAINGSGKHTYDGQAAKTSEGNYTIQLPGQSTTTNVAADNLVFVDANGKVITAPTDAGTYTIALSDAYKQSLQGTYGNNYNLNYTNGTFTVAPKVVDLILNGTASQVYNGQPAKVTDVSGLTLTWGDHTTITAPGGVQFTLTPDDLEVVDGQGNVPTKANAADQETNPYYIKLKDSILTGLNSQNKNYTFKIGDTYARYTIYAKESNVALTGEQDANYGDNPMPAINPKKFTLTWTDTAGTSHTIKLNADDLTVEIPQGAKTNNGMPVSAGQYVVKLKQGVIDALNKANSDYNLSNDPNTNAWYVVKHRQVSFTINGTPSSTYNGQAAQIKDGNYSISFGPVSGNQNSGVLSGDQSAFDDIKWKADDFEFVNGAPTNAGTYQVRLSSAGLKKLNEFAQGATGSNYDFSSVATIENGQITASSVTANYIIDKDQLDISLTNKNGQVPSSIIGDYTLNAGNYTLTITSEKPVYGKDGEPLSFTYNLQDDDVFYVTGLPSKVGTYSVQLTAEALQKIEQQFGTDNFDYNPSTSASREITQGNAVITVSGGQTVYYNGQPAVLHHKKYQVTVSTDFFSTGVSLNKGDMAKMVFYIKNADSSYTELTDASGKPVKPTNAGTYYVGLNADMVKLLEDATGNEGQNYKWTFNYAPYVIKSVNRTAIGNFSNSSDYNGQAIAPQTITVTTKYPGAKNTTYTLQKGDYEYVKDGNVVENPTDAGTYTIQLTPAGENHIKQLGNVAGAKENNVNWTIQFNGSYTINQVRMTVTVDGTQKVTYNGHPQTVNIGGQNGINVTLSVPNKPNLTVPSISKDTLTAADFTIKDDEGNVVTDPTNAGHYKVYLNANGLAKLAKLSPNFTVPDSLDQAGDLNIARKEVSVTEGSAGKTFDAQSAALNDEQFARYKKAITDAGYNADGLTIDGIDWWFDDTVDYGTQGGMTNPIKDIGVYNLRLNAKGQQEIDAANPNYKIKVGDFQYHIYPEVVHIELDNTNSQNTNWTNQPVPVNPTNFVPKFVVYGGPNGDKLVTDPKRDDGQPLTLPEGVQLEPGDYEFVDAQGNVIKNFTRSDGTTSTNPFKVGTYYVRLTEAGWKKLAIQSTDNVHYQYSGTGTLNIKQITPEININGANWKTYDGQPVSYQELVSDPATQQKLINVTITSDGHTITFPLKDGDYVWSANGQTLDGAPTNVGIYAVTLDKDKVMKRLQNFINSNSDYQGAMNILEDNIGGSAVFEIKAHDIKDIVADPSSGSKAYDGTAANISLSTLADSIHATDNAGHVWKLNTANLTLAKDYTITDANGRAVTDFPINVGKYTFVLNAQGIKDLAEANPNFTIPNEITGYSYTYTITPAEATAKLSGNAEKTYDGQKVTTDEVNAGTSTVSVSINANKTIVYTLQDGDYDWYDQDGNKLSSVPTDVGIYTIKLNNQNVLAHLRAKIAADPEWTVKDKDGKAIIDNVVLNETNDKGEPNLTGFATFTIAQKETTLTVNGNQTLPDATVHPQNFSVSGTGVDGKQITISGLHADDFQLIDASGNVVTNPESGSYQVVLTQAAKDNIQNDYPNYKFNFSSSAVMNVQSQLTVQFIDTDNKGSVVQSVDYTQMGSSTIPLSLTMPAGYESADGKALPTSYDLTKAVNQTLTIYLKHQTVVITPTSPSTDIPTGPIPGKPGQNFKQMESIVATPTRTINVTDPQGKTDQTVQHVEFTRTATFDMVTGEITYTGWTQQGSQSTWDAFNIPAHDGYTALVDGKAADTIAANKNVSADTPSQTINISYAANDQSMEIVYQDATGKVVHTDTVNGKTDQTVKTNSSIPVGWKLADGQQTAPSEITFGSAGHANITIIIEHGTTNVSHKQPVPDGQKTPTGKVIKGAHGSELNQIITRIINVTMPNGDKSIETQTAYIYRDATYDDVTGDVTYGNWSTDATDWKEFIPTTVPGYTASRAKIPAVEVKDGQWSEVLNITYTADPQSVTIKFVDDDENGQQVGKAIPKQGVTDQTISDLNLTTPEHYNLATGQTLPTSYKFTADKDQMITIHLVHATKTVDGNDPTNIPANVDKSKLIHTVTRTITDNVPGQKPIVTKQTAQITRSATYDEVTGDLSNYSAWTTAKLPGYTAKGAKGYTPSQAKISAEEVTDGTPAESSINITYTKKAPIESTDVKKVTRTIIVKQPNEQTTSVQQTVTFTRPAYLDEATGKVTYGAWDQQTATWNAYDPVAITGYTAHGVSAKTVTPLTKDETVTVTYTKNAPIESTDVKKVTRTIVVKQPNGQTTSVKQTVTFTRSAYLDKATGKVTYGAWDQQTATWDAYVPAAITGYTAQSVSSETVTPTTKDETVTVAYTKNPVEENASEKVQFVDQHGQVIGSSDYQGKLGQVIAVRLNVPAGYRLADGQEFPTQITINNGVITIHVVASANNRPDQPQTPERPNDNGHPVTPGQPGVPGKPTENHGEAEGTNAVFNTGNQQSEYANVSKQEKGKLPQTGNDNARLGIISGLLTFVLGLLGLAGSRNRKKGE